MIGSYVQQQKPARVWLTRKKKFPSKHIDTHPKLTANVDEVVTKRNCTHALTRSSYQAYVLVKVGGVI